MPKPSSRRSPRTAATRKSTSSSSGPRSLCDLVARFEEPERVVWQKPAEVMAVLHVAEGERVADLGAGSGYFTVALGRAVAPGGVVYAVDTDPAMLRYIRARVAKDRVPAVRLVEARPGDPSLPEPVDLMFICNAYHHLEDRARYLVRLRELLRPGGRVAIIDWKKQDLPIGPPTVRKLSAAEIVREMKKAGFATAARHGFLPNQTFLIFTAARER